MQRHLCSRYNAGMTISLNAAQIASLSVAARQGLVVEVLASTASTNAALRARAATLEGPLLLAAETQTAGRGRAGRSWHAAPADSLCFSLAWNFPGSVARVAGLSLAVGVAVAEALNALGWRVQLKWPNDVLLDGAKLGGILIETASRSSQEPRVSKIGQGPWAVIGIGLNVRANALRDASIGHPVASLVSLEDVSPDRNLLLAKIADSLSTALAAFDRDGLSAFIARWLALHAYQGRVVRLTEGATLLHEGIAHGIDDSGRLLLDTDQGRVAVAAGDVSLRLAGDQHLRGALHAAD